MNSNIGLVLEGGGTRGVYTAGVLDAFLDFGIDFSYIIGVSAGACCGLSFITKQRKRQYRCTSQYIKDKRYMGFVNLIKTGEFLGSDFIFNELAYNLIPIDADAFERSPTEFKVVVTNCHTGQAEYRTVTSVRNECPLVQASCALPMITHGVEIDGELLFDGGISDSIPLAQAKKDGYQKNVVILTQDPTYVKAPNRAMRILNKAYSDYPHLLASLHDRHILYNQERELVKQEAAQGSVFLIQPQEPVTIGTLDRSPQKLGMLYAQGYGDGRSSIDALQAFLQEDS